MNAFFIVPTSVKRAAADLFSTHPPMEKRIEALQRLETQLQTAARRSPPSAWASSTGSWAQGEAEGRGA